MELRLKELPEMIKILRGLTGHFYKIAIVITTLELAEKIPDLKSEIYGTPNEYLEDFKGIMKEILRESKGVPRQLKDAIYKKNLRRIKQFLNGN